MELEKRKGYLRELLRDTQRVRSKLLEAFGGDDAAPAVLESLDPWVFGNQCIIPILSKLLMGEPTDVDVMNFVAIANLSLNLQTEGTISGRYDPETEEIFS